ncbi:MFS transporter [Tsukamurella sp. 8F]|uniref:MFS transporter n=1 Tax=unclassified Tsukamurella TaxID=2633480 RepID=UPI0023B99F91|nr:MULTISPECIES: MFS transporter [unclassified Tsukamurella]MDF0530636.1 MFS transporter [Tsukamurella sp. 8J]MDF0587837.1 MFS transporter [Tsukamurella sp. 8F]
MTTTTREAAPARPLPAVLALTFGITMLVAGEFLPAGVLPAVARDLSVSPGTVGLAVAATALAGALTAPTIASIVPRMDRRTVLVGLLALATISDAVVALAPHIAVLLAGRLILGVAIAGYWSFAFGAGVHVAQGRSALVSTSLASGTSVATIIGVPLASLLGDTVGWRTVFWLATALTALATVVLYRVLTPVPAHPSAGTEMMRRALRNRRLVIGAALVALAVLGNFIAYPFIRLAIERVDAGAGSGSNVAGGAAVLLLVWGVGGLAGNLLAGVLSRWLRWAVALGPLIVSIALAATLTTSVPVLFLAIAAWGIGFNLIPVTTQLWVTTVGHDTAESAVALQVTAFQTAITAGAVTGGLLVDHVGLGAAFLTGSAAGLLAAAGFASIRVRA